MPPCYMDSLKFSFITFNKMRFLIFPGIDRKLLLKENFRGVFIKLHDEKKKKSVLTGKVI